MVPGLEAGLVPVEPAGMPAVASEGTVGMRSAAGKAAGMVVDKVAGRPVGMAGMAAAFEVGPGAAAFDRS